MTESSADRGPGSMADPIPALAGLLAWDKIPRTMTFASITFLLFLTLVFCLYWPLRRREPQNALLIAAGYAFYAWWDWRFCGLLLASSVTDYALGATLGRVRNPRGRRGLLWISVAANLGLLGFFKYFNFFAGSLQALMSS